MNTNLPNWKEAASELRTACYSEAEKIYGDNIPPQVKVRLEEELEYIIGHGHEGVYLLTKEIIEGSDLPKNSCYYRGAVGNSFVAYLLGLTNTVNPLPAHYRCRERHYYEFPDVERNVICLDLPVKTCPICGEPLLRDGFQLLFDLISLQKSEEPLEFDINVPISKLGAVVDSLKRNKRVSKAIRLGKKDSSGLVPSFDDDNLRGYYIIPRGKENLVGDKIISMYNGDEITDSLSGDIDKSIYVEWILGYKPTELLYLLGKFTGCNPAEVDIFDHKLLDLISSSDWLKKEGQLLACSVGTLGVPEFRYGFIRWICKKVAQPKSFSELIKICGLMRGTGTWDDNAEKLLSNRTVSLEQVIATRDDLYDDCLKKGIDRKTAYEIMKSVQFGKGLTDSQESIMTEAGLEEWYIDSCKKIEYLYTRSHCTACILHSLRCLYFKMYYPEDYYRANFGELISMETRRQLLNGKEQNLQLLDEMYDISPGERDRELYEALLLAEEMYDRGFDVL